MTSIPETLSEYDWLELCAFDRKADWEGYAYAAANYPPRFEFANYELIDRAALRALHQRHSQEMEAWWGTEGAVDAHNAHLDEVQRREEHRALWAVRFANGNVATSSDEESARFMHGSPSWSVEALLTRDEPGGEWREVTEAVPDA